MRLSGDRSTESLGPMLGVGVEDHNLRATQGKLPPTRRVSLAEMILPHETADAKITGQTRSLVRRLLGLNVGGSLRNPICS